MTATVEPVATAPPGEQIKTQASTDQASSTPPGAESMGPPWRLGPIGLGLAATLATRLFVANGWWTTLDSDLMLFAAAMGNGLVGLGLLATAAQRDRFGPSLFVLTAVTALSLAALQWISPYFPEGTLEWSDSTQLALTVLGAANGLVLAGIIALALVRRAPTPSVVYTLATGVLTLAANTLLLRNEWPAILATAAAFVAMLFAWDRAPRHEPTYARPDAAPRVSRAALGLATVALAGGAIQLWASRGDDIGRALPAATVAAALILIAFMGLWQLRREIQQRETTLGEWTAWMREIRTGDLRSDFENLATTDAGLAVGDLTAELPRPLSFPDLRVPDSPAAPPEPTITPGLDLPAGPTPPVPTATPDFDVPAATPAEVPAFDVPAISIPAEAVPATTDTPAASAFPLADLPRTGPADPEPAAAQGRLFDQDSVAHPSDRRPVGAPAPTWTEPEPPAAADIAWLPAADQPSLFDPEPAPPESQPAIARSSAAFSSLLGLEPAPPGPDDLAAWLARPLDPSAATAPGQPRLVVAIETMSLADYDMLPVEVSSAMTTAMVAAIARIAPEPAVVAPIDGPYVMAAWSDIERVEYQALNRILLDILATPVETDQGLVALSAVLALVQVGPQASFDSLIDDAIGGLIRARQLDDLVREQARATP